VRGLARVGGDGRAGAARVSPLVARYSRSTSWAAAGNGPPGASVGTGVAVGVPGAGVGVAVTSMTVAGGGV
jgi:hypothetical protein